MFEKSSATLLETGMEGGREAVFIRDRNGTQPEKVVRACVCVHLYVSTCVCVCVLKSECVCTTV